MSDKPVMWGVWLTGHGGPEKLEWREDIPVPPPGAGEVLVEVLAAGVNNTDINTRIGWYAPEVTSATQDAEGSDVTAGGWGGALSFPRVQGGDLCGRVVMVGEGVTGIAEGMRVTCPINLPRPTDENPLGFTVLGSEIDGSFADFCLMKAEDLYDVSASPLSDIEIAAIPCAFGTAEAMLTRADVKAGQEVLVTGASGGVGLAAVQLARLRGAHVTGQTSPAKAQAVMDAGAEAILHRDETPESGEYDVVIDVVGGDSWGALIDALRPGGHLAVSGAIAGPIVSADLRSIYLNDITIHGSTYQPPKVFSRLVDLINAGDLRPLVSQTYPLRDIQKAQEDFAAKIYPGKLVLVPEGLET